MRDLVIGMFLIFFCFPAMATQPFTKQVKQSKDVIDACQVCQQFRRLLATDLKFDAAYEATCTQSTTRRREIAITDGEFGTLDLTSVDDLTLVSAYKSRMQIFYLLLPLTSPDSKDQEALFFPPEIKSIFERKAPLAAKEFPAYAVQLDKDARQLREHLEHLARQYPAVADLVRKFKTEELAQEIVPPNHEVQSLRSYSRGRVLRSDEPYYSIDGFTVVREGAQMRIVGIRFFTRLF